MSSARLRRGPGVSLLLIAGLITAAGCSKDDPTGPDNNTGAFTLALSSTALTVAPGGTTTATVTVAETNTTDPITLSVEGAPTGLTASFSASPTNSTSTLTLTAVAALAPGSYNLTLKGTGAGMTDQTVPFTVNVVAAGTGTITVSFSACQPGERPVWLATQDGAGAWTRVTGSNDDYQFTMVQPKGGIAFTTVNDSSIVTVEYFSESDLHSGTADYVVRLDRCPIVGSRNLAGDVSGLGAGDVAHVSFGSAQDTVNGNGSFSLNNTRPGTLDLVGYRLGSAGPSATDRILFRRGIDPAPGSTLTTLDFTGSESFAPASATMTVAGLAAGENVRHGMFYYTIGGPDVCQIHNLYNNVPASGNTFTAFGAPAAQQLAPDWHAVAVATDLNNNSFRTLHEYFQAMGARTLTLGAAMPSPTVSVLAGAYKRLQAAVTMPADYQSRASLHYRDPGGTHPSVIVSATMGWLGGSAVSLSLPDFSSVTGWTNSWAPAASVTVEWQLIGSNATNPPHCAAGARFISAIRAGTA